MTKVDIVSPYILPEQEFIEYIKNIFSNDDLKIRQEINNYKEFEILRRCLYFDNKIWNNNENF